MSERMARMEERMISISNDVTEMKAVMERSFSSFGDIANRVSALEGFKKFFILVASALGTIVGLAVEAAINWRSR
jgi:archaellum component FlaC